MKKYYSSYKPYFLVKRPYLLYKLIMATARAFNKTKVIMEEPFCENAPVVVMGNHAREFGPLSYLLTTKRKNRLWMNSNLLYLKTIPGHMMKDIFANAKGIAWGFWRVFTFLFSPAIAYFFRAVNSVPVFKDMRIKTTFVKTFESLEQGHDILIFPESIVPNKDNEYLNELQNGAFKLFEIARSKLKEMPLLYPAYFCKALNTISYGKPIKFNVDIPSKEAVQEMKTAFCAEVKRLALALPPHEITPYGEQPEDIQKIKKFIKSNDKDFERLENAEKNTEDKK